MILLPAAAIETAAVEGDFLVVVVVFVAAIQWRVGKTTAGMTNRALNTNWLSSGIAVSARRRSARTRARRRNRTLSIFSPPILVSPLPSRKLRSGRRYRYNAALYDRLCTPSPADDRYRRRRSAAAHISWSHTRTIGNDHRLRRPTDTVLSPSIVSSAGDCFVWCARRKSRSHTHAHE